ncbi:ORF6N domain-containing protein [Arachidicoccus terrestris]|uniref:ORF6N domain-containing protein n=1 Tax=Arachidicoccus terrestris TaxID=2875539 RepID=UPI0037441D6D
MNDEGNLSIFQEKFHFPLTNQEYANLKSQFVISSLNHGGRRTPPNAFTTISQCSLLS